MNYIINEYGEKSGSLFYSFTKPANMNVDYIKIESNIKKSPNEFINTAICMMQKLLLEGKKKSVSSITCLPLTSNQQKLYSKFGFSKDNKSTNMYVDFKVFEKRVQDFLKKIQLTFYKK